MSSRPSGVAPLNPFAYRDAAIQTDSEIGLPLGPSRVPCRCTGVSTSTTSPSFATSSRYRWTRSCAATPTGSSRPSSGEAFPLDVVALLVDFADRLAFDPALMKGYGKDPSLNGILASLWGFSADRHWSPDFHRVLGNNRIRYRL